MLVTKSMINNHIKYLSKFGTERIKDYTKFLLSFPDLTEYDKEFIALLPRNNVIGNATFEIICDIITKHNLWYTIYL